MALSDKDLKILTENNLRRKYQALFLTSIRFEGIDQATSDYLMSKLMYEGRVAAFKLVPSKLVEYDELVFASFAESKCPILIDQPEDDLDNRSIFDEPIPFIRKRK